MREEKTFNVNKSNSSIVDEVKQVETSQTIVYKFNYISEISKCKQQSITNEKLFAKKPRISF